MSKRRDRRDKQKNSIASLFEKDRPLGGYSAEREHDLLAYFAHESRLIDPIRNHLPDVFIYVGRRGCGKTAIQRYIESNGSNFPAHVIKIAPNDIALWTITRDNVLTDRELTSADDRFITKTLWNFIFAVEVLSREYGTMEGAKEKILSLFRASSHKLERTKRLLERGLQDDAKVSLTARFLAILEEVRAEVTAKAGAAEVGVDVTAKIRRPESIERKGSILNDLTHVVEQLGSLLSSQYVLLVDDLDQDWSGKKAHTALLEGLIQSIMYLGRSGRVSFVVAMRDDIFSSLEVDDRVKIRQHVRLLEWKTQSLEEMLRQRIAWVTQRPLSTSLLDLIFEPGVALAPVWQCANENPRRAIHILEESIISARKEGHHRVTEKVLRDSIEFSSREFLLDLDAQYRFVFPGLKSVADVIHGGHREFGADAIDAWHTQLLARLEETDAPFRWVGGLRAQDGGFQEVLLRTGLLYFKEAQTTRARPFDYERDRITPETWYAVNPAYAKALALIGT